MIMSKQRKHMHSLQKKVFEDETVGAYAALGGPFFVKKMLGEAAFYVQASATVYQQIPTDCFEQTISRSRTLDTASIKKRLELFNEQ